MIAFNHTFEVEIDLSYTNTSDITVEVSDNSVTFSGTLYEEIDDDVSIEAYELVDQLTEVEADELHETIERAFPDLKSFEVQPIIEMPVDSIYEGMDIGQRAHMFNKLLKHQDYNAHSVSLLRVAQVLIDIHAAQKGLDS